MKRALYIDLVTAFVANGERPMAISRRAAGVTGSKRLR